MISRRISNRAIKRFFKNKPAVIGLFIIITATFTAIFAYLLVTDKTPDADDQILQLETHPPGFTIQLFKRAKNKDYEPCSKWQLLWNGCPNPYELIPILDHHFEGEHVWLNVYRGKGKPAEMRKLHLVDVVYPALLDSNSIIQHHDTLIFHDIHGTRHTVTIKSLQEKIAQDHIITRKFLLGTDKFGRDVFSRLLLGIRVSLSVGLVAVLISLVIGILLGSIAGYFRGWVDDVFMWFINVFWAIPTLLLVFALILAIGQQFWLIYVAVGLTMWVDMARVVRGQFFSIREKEFVEAARSMGFPHWRTIFIHILPNLTGAIIVIAAQNFATAILIEAGLSFLGIGVQPPKPSWGAILKEYYTYIGTEAGYLALFPALAIMLMVLAFNLVGNGLRDAADVRTNL